MDLGADLAPLTFLMTSVRSESQEEEKRSVNFVKLGASLKPPDKQETSSCFANPTMSIVMAFATHKKLKSTVCVCVCARAHASGLPATVLTQPAGQLF